MKNIFNTHSFKSLVVMGAMAGAGYAGVAATYRDYPTIKSNAPGVKLSDLKDDEIKEFGIKLDDGEYTLKVSCPKNSYYDNKCQEKGR